MTDKWIEPNAEQQAQALIAHHEIIETMNRLIREGFDARIVMAGVGAATSDLITTQFGNTAVAPWFEKQAQMVRDVTGPRN